MAVQGSCCLLCWAFLRLEVPLAGWANVAIRTAVSGHVSRGRVIWHGGDLDLPCSSVREGGGGSRGALLIDQL